jgi:hypothetical protein
MHATVYVFCQRQRDAAIDLCVSLSRRSTLLESAHACRHPSCVLMRTHSPSLLISRALRCATLCGASPMRYLDMRLL